MIKGIAHWTRQMMGYGCGLGLENFLDAKAGEVVGRRSNTNKSPADSNLGSTHLRS
jgi:hypothetical protein